MRHKMALGYVRIHEGHYLVYREGSAWADIDNDNGDWELTINGERNENIKFKDIREAKKFLENIVLREYTNDVGC
jgi:hypothetical protein